MTHLSDHELQRWREGHTADRDRIVAHVAACDACGGRLAELVRTAPASGPASTFDPASFRDAGLQTGQWRAGARRGPWRYIPVAAAAAAVIVAVVYFGPARRDAVTRGGADAVRLVQPSGTVDATTLTFTWAGPEGPYGLRVFDPGNITEPVIARDAATTGYQPSPEERARLRAGVSYRWFVESESGQTSAAGRFTVR